MNTTDVPSARHAGISELDKLDETELYPDCNFMSAFNFLAKLMHMKVDSKWTNTSFDKLLQLLTTAFPLANIPKSHYEAKKKMSEIGLVYEAIHVFKNDCYFNAYIKSSVTAKDVVWHATGQCKEEGKMRHPVDGISWKKFDARYPDFASEPRNVRLGLSSDGFNPFGNMNNAYNSSFMLTLLIPGPKLPRKDMDVFLRPLVDELKDLWSNGVETKDSFTNSVFTMRVALLMTINDFPAHSSLSGWSGQGYYACSICNVDTPCIETRPPPRRRTNDEILEQLRPFSGKALQREPGKHPEHGGKKKRCDETVEGNWSKKSIFYELRYWSNVELKHNLDVMHIEKNVCESLLNTLLKHKEKSKDTVNARKVLKEWGIRSELWMKPSGNNRKEEKPHPNYSFSTADRSLFCLFIRGVKLPDGFGSNFRTKVTDDDTKIPGLKSHDHHLMMQRLLPIGLRAFLDSFISTPLIELCLFFKQLCVQTLKISDMEDAKTQLINILCSLEQIFSPSFFDIMIHLVMYLPEEAVQGGLVYMRWMYPFERYMKKLKNYIRNKARPEGSIAEGYVADEALTYASRYLDTVKTRFNRPDRNFDASVPQCKHYVFQSVCRPISKGDDVDLDPDTKAKISWFILNNSYELDKYRE
ncbi:uncharacterized protein [Rutidosis leptorrhynchoides]|uniref:uncharacterized protein n=1 Tax=Rutidosis leptorrhynchoides TaxID=125765 RepID=UPI003A9943CF